MKILLVLFFSVISLCICAQDIDEVFDDGGLASISNNVSFSFSDIKEGYLTINYERYLGEHIGLGFGFGPLLFDGKMLGYSFVMDEPTDTNSYNKGFKLDFHYRIYFGSQDGFLINYNFGYRNVKNDYLSKNIFEILTFSIGYKWMFYNHFSLIGYAGAGFHFSNSRSLIPSNQNNSSIDNEFGFQFPIRLELAYGF